MIRLVQNSFFGGQLDYEMMGRQDYQRYAKGATKLLNFNIMKRGGLDKRRGFDRIMDLTTLSGVTASTKFRAIPFAYKKSEGFVLLMSGPKCVVVGTSPNNQFTYYNVNGLDGVYTATDIESIDYQQCGDVLFLANQNHKPAKIEHVIDNSGQHGFHYSTIDVSAKKYGIPSINSALIVRLLVSDPGEKKRGSEYMEHYKATAVFEDGETFPCSAFSQEHGSPWGIRSWYGTNYPMPWTESQTITLSMTVNPRTNADGSLEYPTEVRIYKKSFSYYGLIGSVKVNGRKTYSAVGLTTSGITVHNSTGTNLINAVMTSISGNELPYNGKNCRGYQYPINTNHGLSSTVNVSKADTIILGFGCCYRSTTSTTASEVTFTYKASKANKIELLTGNTVVESAGIPYGEDKTLTLTKGAEEEQSSFNARVDAEYEDFVQNASNMYSTKIQITKTAQIDRIKFKGDSGTYGILFNIQKLTVSASQSISFVDNYITPDASNTPPEEPEDFDELFTGSGNYPASVSLSQQRLIWASSKNDPARIWMSEIGDFYNYTSHEIQLVSDSIDFRLPITRFAKINHICEMRKLLMFNSACEWLVDSSSSVQGLTYETIQAYPQSYSGSNERLKPIICNNSLIFCERTGQAVRRFAYDISNDGFAGRDVSVLSSSIFENNNIVDWTYQQFPYSTLWCVMNDGNMASFEFMEEQDIMAWMTHKLGGDGKVVCISTTHAVSPALDVVTEEGTYQYATHEEVFAVVRRQGHLWLERMRVRSKPAVDGGNYTDDTLYHSLCLDGCRVLNSTNGYQPTQETGAVWIPSDTTDGSTITRAEALTKIADGVDVYEGFPFDAVYESVYPNVNNGNIGYGQFDIKHVQGIGLRLMFSYGGKIRAKGAEFDEPIPYFYNDPENDHRAVFEDGNVRLFNHDTNIMSLSGVNNRDGRIVLTQGDPYPFGLLSYEIDFEPEIVSYGGALS